MCGGNGASKIWEIFLPLRRLHEMAPGLHGTSDKRRRSGYDPSSAVQQLMAYRYKALDATGQIYQQGNDGALFKIWKEIKDRELKGAHCKAWVPPRHRPAANSGSRSSQQLSSRGHWVATGRVWARSSEGNGEPGPHSERPKARAPPYRRGGVRSLLRSGHLQCLYAKEPSQEAPQFFQALKNSLPEKRGSSGRGNVSAIFR